MDPTINTISQFQLLFHLSLALLTSFFVCGAGLFTLLLSWQDYSLRYSRRGRWLYWLPSIESSERWVFGLTIVGFVLLSVLISSSFYFFADLVWQLPWLWHKALLAILAWSVFAVVLWGRWQFGWRGRIATYSIGCGVLLLVIVYVISQMALEG